MQLKLPCAWKIDIKKKNYSNFDKMKKSLRILLISLLLVTMNNLCFKIVLIVCGYVVVNIVGIYWYQYDAIYLFLKKLKKKYNFLKFFILMQLIIFFKKFKQAQIELAESSPSPGFAPRAEVGLTHFLLRAYTSWAWARLCSTKNWAKLAWFGSFAMAYCELYYTNPYSFIHS